MLLKLLLVLAILLLLNPMLHRSLLEKSMLLCAEMGALLGSHCVGISRRLIEVVLWLWLRPVCHGSILWCHSRHAIHPIHHYTLGHLGRLSYHANMWTGIVHPVRRSNLSSYRRGVPHSWSALRDLGCAMSAWTLPALRSRHGHSGVSMLHA